MSSAMNRKNLGPLKKESAPKKTQRLRMRAVYSIPPQERVKRVEREDWRKQTQRNLDNGGAYNRADISNVDFMRVLKLIDAREEEIRELTKKLASQ